MTNDAKAAKRLRDMDAARQEVKVRIMDWYLDRNFDIPPEMQCEDKKSYKGKVLWWLEPPIPHIDNPCMVEEYIGDQWTLRIDKLVKT